MRSVRRIVVLACTVVAIAAFAPAVSANSTPMPIHLTKDCSTYDGEIPSLCTILSSDLSLLPSGTKVWYQGPILTNNYFLSSNMLLESTTGATASGYCIFDARAIARAGLCTFWTGTGSLSGFTAILHVTIDDAGTWHLDGEYYFNADVIKHSSSGRLASPRPF